LRLVKKCRRRIHERDAKSLHTPSIGHFPMRQHSAVRIGARDSGARRPAIKLGGIEIPGAEEHGRAVGDEHLTVLVALFTPRSAALSKGTETPPALRTSSTSCSSRALGWRNLFPRPARKPGGSPRPNTWLALESIGASRRGPGPPARHAVRPHLPSRRSRRRGSHGRFRRGRGSGLPAEHT